MNKKERLEDIKRRIESNTIEYGFNELYELLQHEIRIEGFNNERSHYYNNLIQTESKQAQAFITCKQREKQTFYDSFLINFKQDITEELRRLRNRGNSSIK